MPLTTIQTAILKQIAKNRNPGSYLAGATVLHRKEGTPRFSQDIDLFHDLEDSVARSAESDADTLRACGYTFEWILRTPFFFRAVVTSGTQRLKMEWAQDSAFRFFPVLEDPFCGFRLHDADAAINKVLALAGRTEIRDYVDVLHLHETYLSLGAMSWAACGKDPGFTIDFLLDQCGRHAVYSQADLDRLDLRVPLDIKTLKTKWLEAMKDGKRLAENLPPNEIGCLYLDQDGQPVTPNPSSDRFLSLVRHTGRVSGAWPTVSAYVQS